MELTAEASAEREAGDVSLRLTVRNEGRNPAAGTYTVEATLTATDDRPAATATVEV